MNRVPGDFNYTRDTMKDLPHNLENPRISKRNTADESRKLIIDAATQFLWEHPFRELTAGSLMTKTGLSRPAFYQYYRSVHELIEDLLRELEAEMVDVASPWLAGEGDSHESLHASLAGVVSVCVDHGHVFRAISEAAPLDERLEEAWSGFMNRWDGAVTARIVAEQRVGAIGPCDAAALGSALNKLDAAVLIAEFGRRPQGNPERVTETLFQIWTRTLYGT